MYYYRPTFLVGAYYYRIEGGICGFHLLNGFYLFFNILTIKRIEYLATTNCITLNPIALLSKVKSEFTQSFEEPKSFVWQHSGCQQHLDPVRIMRTWLTCITYTDIQFELYDLVRFQSFV